MGKVADSLQRALCKGELDLTDKDKARASNTILQLSAFLKAMAEDPGAMEEFFEGVSEVVKGYAKVVIPVVEKLEEFNLLPSSKPSTPITEENAMSLIQSDWLAKNNYKLASQEEVNAFYKENTDE